MLPLRSISSLDSWAGHRRAPRRSARELSANDCRACGCRLSPLVPPARGAEKKRLAVTPRDETAAGSAGWLVSAVGAGAAIWLTRSAGSTTSQRASPSPARLGFALFLLAPVWLVAGNCADHAASWKRALRRRYLKRAADTLDKIKPKVVGITGSYGKTTTKNFPARYHERPLSDLCHAQELQYLDGHLAGDKPRPGR